MAEIQEIPEGIFTSTDLILEMPEEIPEEIQEQIPELIPEEIQEQIPEEIPEEIQEQIPEQIPEEIQEQIPEQILTDPVSEEIVILTDPDQQIRQDQVVESQSQMLEVQKQILSILLETKEEDSSVLTESEEVIEEETETTTGAIDLIYASIGNLEQRQTILINDQRTIGIVQTGILSMVLGALVIWFFLGRLR